LAVTENRNVLAYNIEVGL